MTIETSDARASFSRLTQWAHRLVAEVLRPGALVVDLTAGNGHDSQFLWQGVAPNGRVLAFDVQEDALLASRVRLEKAGAPVHVCAKGMLPSATMGVHLIADGHECLSHYVREAPCAIMANLGYLPGGDHRVATATPTTLSALEQSLRILAPAGRLAVTAYPGHAGGVAETAAVAEYLQDLDGEGFEILELRVVNSSRAPCLWVVQKRGG
ncbi:rRNA methyltransferase [Geoalkalibacter halelectricus]|uniref:rRNA methyltransferase n=1 Tax=Geoalkalibacter halelectricus TaxID=2847045 RepID=A0ABY5ZVC2_9BACT|nr:class I SAM-dependent methyltransferase [Geoalkalibacter halelectricus]MDO3376932.1 rRNA methyltransferase [Geoalkalibacter halelectricus]UWZ81156.1 rRNA methyltransferase [Geoalkalibacter halelectricus]